jgi:hypothetical protein
MSEDLNAAPAAAADSDTSAAVPEALTMSEAVDLLSQDVLEEEKDQTPPEKGESSEEEEEANPGEEPESEDEPLDFDKIHGNTKVRLRDRTEVPFSEIKRRWDDLQNVERSKAELTQHQQSIQVAAQRIQAEQASIAQQAQILQQVGPLLLEQARSAVPPEVSEEIWDTDPIEAGRLDRIRNKQIAKFQQMQQGFATVIQKQQEDYQRSLEQAKMVHEEQAQSYAKQEFDALIDEMPSLRDEAKRKVFVAQIVKGAEILGYSQKDLAGVHDRRLLKGLVKIANAATYEGQKAAVSKKVANVPPVRAPGSRTTEPDTGKANDPMARLERARKNGGQMSDIASILSSID